MTTDCQLLINEKTSLQVKKKKLELSISDPTLDYKTLFLETIFLAAVVEYISILESRISKFPNI